MAFKPTRRFFIYSGLAAGALVVGYALTPFSTLSRARQIAGKGEAMLAAWVRIAPDNTITVIVPHSEMGQGVHTSLPMMLAEELDADWSLVRMEQAPADIAFANGALARGFLTGDMSIPSFLSGTTDFLSRKASEMMSLQVTGGSMSIRSTGVFGMRRTGAAAKAMLIKAAAETWNVPESEIVAKLSRLTHAASGKSATYGEMAVLAAEYDAPVDAPLKAKKDYTIVGTNVARFDIPAKVDGTALYGMDVRLPGLLFAAVAHSPVFGGKLKSVDEAPALAVKGVKKVLKLDDAVVVIADNTWRARTALAALTPAWDDGPGAAHSSSSILAGMEAALGKAEAGNDWESDYDEGDAPQVIAAAARTVEATYRLPFLAHATMEPMNATAWFKDGKLELWGGFQDGLGVRAIAASLADMKADDIIIHHAAMGGGFGRRAFSPNLPDTKANEVRVAIAAARAMNAPVQCAFSREEDMTQDFYRDASVAKMKAGLDANGRITGFIHAFAERHDPPEATVIAYDVPDRVARFVTGTNPIPWGPWRSVDHTQHGFFIESFIDELAAAAKQDPLAFRLAHLGNAPRHKAALEKVAAMSGWTTPPAEGRARGIAMREAFGTIVAQVAEVSISDDGRARVHKMWSAVDPGEVIHPATFKAQIAGGAIYGLTAALYGGITIEKGAVVEKNFPDYDMVRMADAPTHEVAIIESGAKTGGAGEPGTAPVAAAVGNAIFALTGQRIRELPFRKFDLKTGGQIARA
jgi:isoquinoline 1-oxidoreductase beta subunit